MSVIFTVYENEQGQRAVALSVSKPDEVATYFAPITDPGLPASVRSGKPGDMFDEFGGPIDAEALEDETLSSAVSAMRTNTSAMTPPVVLAGDASFHAIELACKAAFAKAVRRYESGAGINSAVEVLGSTLEVLMPRALAIACVKGADAADMPKHKLVAAAEETDFELSFNVKSAEVTAWAKQHTAELIKGIKKTVRDSIKSIIAKQLKADLAAREIKKVLSDPTRASLIAHTETQRAAHAGQQLAWEKAEKKGLLPKSTKREWITTPDDRLCEICAALDGKVANLHGAYGDGIPHPPAHPRCRCTEGLRIE